MSLKRKIMKPIDRHNIKKEIKQEDEMYTAQQNMSDLKVRIENRISNREEKLEGLETDFVENEAKYYSSGSDILKLQRIQSLRKRAKASAYMLNEVEKLQMVLEDIEDFNSLRRDLNQHGISTIIQRYEIDERMAPIFEDVFKLSGKGERTIDRTIEKVEHTYESQMAAMPQKERQGLNTLRAEVKEKYAPSITTDKALEELDDL